ncbi:MAG: ornithine cyclodeaminase family protein [Chloroflexi bacterium]|nr:ornithine cyclodeaminase family protein [Chloroflexota bacterium]
MLILSNEDARQVLTMKACIEALDRIFQDQANGDADHRRRMDFFVPCERTDGYYRWSTTEGASRGSGILAIRIKSDVLYFPGGKTIEWYAGQPGTYCGLIMLFNTNTGEPLALMQDAIISHIRAGASAGLGAKYLARADAASVGMLGSGGMARTYLEAFCEVRKISRAKVFSPTPENRLAYAREMSRALNIPVEAVDKPELAVRGSDIVSTCTDSMRPTVDPSWVEPGMFITDCRPNEITAEVKKLCDVQMKLGKARFSHGIPSMGVMGEYAQAVIGKPDELARIPMVPPRDLSELPTLVDLLTGHMKGRSNAAQITYFANDGAQGLQFAASAGKVYELAKARGLGRTIPQDWLLQTIRD